MKLQIATDEFVCILSQTVMNHDVQAASIIL